MAGWFARARVGSGSRSCEQFWHPGEVVGGKREVDALLGAAVDVGAPPGPAGIVMVLRDMRRDPALAEFGDEIGGIEALVSGQHAAGSDVRIRQVDRREPLRVTAGPRLPGVHQKPVAALHQRRGDKAEQARLARGLAVERRVRVSCRGVSLVRAPLAAEVAHRVAPAAIAARIVTAAVAVLILRPEALHAGPGVDQRAVRREVVPAHLPPHIGVVHDAGQEHRPRFQGQEPLAVLGEGRGVITLHLWRP